MYNRKDGGSYSRAGFTSFGIIHEQLIITLATRLSKHIKEVPPLNWCQTVEQMLEKVNLFKLFSAMKKKNGHNELLEENNAVLCVLASLMTYFITEKRMLTFVKLTVVIHGMSKIIE